MQQTNFAISFTNSMNHDAIIDDYAARDIHIKPEMAAWMRSNHAGETGAVWIYRGARCAFWNERIISMADEHGSNEQRHLVVMEHLLPAAQRSHLLPIWRVSGFMLGLLPAVFGYRAFCITIEAVETFVEQHYQEQIHYLQEHDIEPELCAVLQRCCDEEVEHQHDAANKHGLKQRSRLQQAWRQIVGTGSELAVRMAKAI